MISLMNKMGSGDSENMVNLDSKLLGALQEDGVDQNVVSEELNSLEDSDQFTQAKSCRKKLEHILHATPLEIFLVVLVVIDVIILLAMLLIDLNVLQLKLEDMTHGAEYMLKTINTVCDNPSVSHYHGTDLTKIAKYFKQDGCPAPSNHTDNKTEPTKQSDVIHHRRRRGAGAGDSSNPTVIMLLEVGHILHIMSITILAVMFIEVLLKIYAMGKKYFKGKLEVVDGLIISISFALDIYFTDGVGPKGDKNNAASILVVLLMWRIVRVFNALLVTAKKRLEFRIRVQKRMRKLLDDKLSAHQDEMLTLENHIVNLERMAKLHEIAEFEIRACKPLSRAIKKPNTSAGLASMMQMSMGLMKGMNTVGNKTTSTNSSNCNSNRDLLTRQVSKELNLENNVENIAKKALHLKESDEETPHNPSQPCIDFVQAVSTGTAPPTTEHKHVVPPALELAQALVMAPIEETPSGQEKAALSGDAVKPMSPTSSEDNTPNISLVDLTSAAAKEESASENEGETIPLLDLSTNDRSESKMLPEE